MFIIARVWLKSCLSVLGTVSATQPCMQRGTELKWFLRISTAIYDWFMFRTQFLVVHGKYIVHEPVTRLVYITFRDEAEQGYVY